MSKQKPAIPNEAPPKPDNPILAEYAWAEMWRDNGNTLWTVVGDTGSGKSYASLRLGEVIDPDFSIDNVAFNIVEFVKLVNDDSYGRGSVIVLEEGSVEASSYDWHSKSNRVFAQILDTWRHQNRMGIINLPNFQALEKGARRRTKGIVKMDEAAPWADYSEGRFYKSVYGHIEDGLKTPKATIQGMERPKIRFNMPSEDLREAYEEKKKDYTSELNERLLEELLEEERAEEEEEQTPKQIADTILEKEDGEKYIKEYNGRKSINQELIEVDYGVGARKGKKVKAVLERELSDRLE